ncbi:MAG: hypothetical protein KatS3mg049_2601 [Caldilinea sp.]|nr:MAG: hypothetical protein KatS3mg049_2601 [Caldilinea sp.]
MLELWILRRGLLFQYPTCFSTPPVSVPHLFQYPTCFSTMETLIWLRSQLLLVIIDGAPRKNNDNALTAGLPFADIRLLPMTVADIGQCA